MTVQSEVEALLHRLVHAWNRGDAASFAALFSVDADYVTGDGEWLRGRAAIERLVERGNPVAQASIQGDASIRVLGGVTSVLFRWAASDGGGVSGRGVISCVLRKSSEGWLIDRLQNTDEKAPPGRSGRPRGEG